jgi:hypothetical protein
MSRTLKAGVPSVMWGTMGKQPLDLSEDYRVMPHPAGLIKWHEDSRLEILKTSKNLHRN